LTYSAIKQGELFSKVINKAKKYSPYISKENIFVFFNAIFHDILKITHLNGSHSTKLVGFLNTLTSKILSQSQGLLQHI
jgi:hypothetical protein